MKHLKNLQVHFDHKSRPLIVDWSFDAYEDSAIIIVINTFTFVFKFKWRRQENYNVCGLTLFSVTKFLIEHHKRALVIVIDKKCRKKLNSDVNFRRGNYDLEPHININVPLVYCVSKYLAAQYASRRNLVI